MNLARPFKAGQAHQGISRRVATTGNLGPDSIVATRREQQITSTPALKRRAKLMPTLRVEDISRIQLLDRDDGDLVLVGKSQHLVTIEH
jgi:hypothetical protein